MGWLWKHRKVKRELKQLWDNRIELIHFMRDIDFALNLQKKPTDEQLVDIGKRAKYHYEWLGGMGGNGRIRAPRPWPDPPPLRRTVKVRSISED